MLGFGALRAMNDAVKANHELLKSNKKGVFGKDLNYALRTGEIVFKDKPASPDTIARIRASALRDRRQENLKAILIGIVSVLILIASLYFLAQEK